MTIYIQQSSNAWHQIKMSFADATWKLNNVQVGGFIWLNVLVQWVMEVLNSYSTFRFQPLFIIGELLMNIWLYNYNNPLYTFKTLGRRYS